ncbi:Uncharacterised protein [Zhongshania aliphaticivorans]|uniref:Tll0287-like domain-containing protein n=1 Tax=Zhongshania aliphaticivorans TaxID=1470434 RepID=A0A5S9QH72_9GAMM|nr:DUF3365 domain-containing protein [Zhongshania aliphaticivorans]CAA0110158.1 Uncharacterised protein [Zhongshania aliphaticivorans]CAA0118018.1 Uncharacterised protein [Zhongshania aliphaticivorans]CAA0121917.1 Uncharacterised protein [Zhongshania aliphaticivorans]
MKSIFRYLFVINLLVMSSGFVSSQSLVSAEDQQQARALVSDFGKALKSVLVSSIAEDGLINAVEVCQLQAPLIAENKSNLSAWRIARTSLKVRNEKNAPDAWESEVLQRFETLNEQGEDVSKMEYFELTTQNEEAVLRYMKPISTAGLCLACHGERVSPELASKINHLYPNDMAVGFKMGDIRGAFSLQKTLD